MNRGVFGIEKLQQRCTQAKLAVFSPSNTGAMPILIDTGSSLMAKGEGEEMKKWGGKIDEIANDFILLLNSVSPGYMHIFSLF